MIAETERIAAALEPELREVIDMTMERVAEIEQETMREARELMVSAGQNSQEALDRSSRLVNSLDALTGTVSQVTSALRTEVDDVTESLRGLHGLKVELPEEMAGNASDAEPQHAEPQLHPSRSRPAGGRDRGRRTRGSSDPRAASTRGPRAEARPLQRPTPRSSPAPS